MAKLEVKHLTISFRTTNGAVRAVRDISFDLQEGETLAIAGESGSGKSVTTRAVMGILAGNAMVDGGEIIYDGKDLLKIPEEEFHNLRGHKLAMVFQDPLSALNPVMRIGRQLTEAMLLNNKERRRDGRESFNKTLKTLEEKMNAAGGIQNVSEKAKEFDDFVKIAVKEEFAYKEATEAMVEALDGVDEVESAIIRHDDKDAREACGRIVHALKGVYNPYTFRAGDAKITGFSTKLQEYKKSYVARQQTELESLLQEIKDTLNAPLNAESPNFFCIGYSVKQGKAPD
ncbi:MAG: ABC transporter ATP-binding protein, partial [Clostridia bacterium]|nr:ABC transporter ATP-binding protein [Clostridia bacterium]